MYTGNQEMILKCIQGIKKWFCNVYRESRNDFVMYTWNQEMIL